MRQLLLILFLGSSVSCTIVRSVVGNTPHANRAIRAETGGPAGKELWVGKSSDDLILHPVLATKTMEKRSSSNGVEVISFNKLAAEAVTPGCGHVFYLRGNVIFDYHRVGACTEDEDLRLTPRVTQ